MKIFGFRYKVVEDIAINNLGLKAVADSDAYIIRLSVGMSDQQKIATILHEIVEAAKDHVGLADKFEHPWIDMLEMSILTIMVDNGVDLTPLLNGVNKDVH